MSRAPMNKVDLLFRAIHKAIDGELATGGFKDNVKFMSIPVQFNSEGELNVLDLNFTTTLNIHTGEFSTVEQVVFYMDAKRNKEDAVTMEIGSFLYMMRLNDEQFNEMEGFREQMRKELSFGKRELNNLRKAAGLPKEIEEQAEEV